MSKMQGSEGKNDYLVVAKNGNSMLGVKPILSVFSTPVGPMMFVGVRVRAAGESSWLDKAIPSDGVVETKKEGLMSFEEDFKQIEFDKVNEARASIEIGWVVKRPPWMINDVSGFIEKAQVVRKVNNWLAKHTKGASWREDTHLIEGFIIGVFSEEILKMNKLYMEHTQELNTGATITPIKELIQSIMEEVKNKAEGSGGVPLEDMPLSMVKN